MDGMSYIKHYQVRCAKCDYISVKFFCDMSTNNCSTISGSDSYLDKRNEKQKICEHEFIEEKNN